MADTHTPEQRSANMSAIRSKGNKSTEEVFASILRKNKITGRRRHYPVEGKPDFVFPKEKVAIFIDGCFWHKCPKCYKRPKLNKQYWDKKIKDDKERDVLKRKRLKQLKWRVVRIWEHELKNSNAAVTRKIYKTLSISQ